MVGLKVFREIHTIFSNTRPCCILTFWGKALCTENPTHHQVAVSAFSKHWPFHIVWATPIRAQCRTRTHCASKTRPITQLLFMLSMNTLPCDTIDEWRFNVQIHVNDRTAHNGCMFSFAQTKMESCAHVINDEAASCHAGNANLPSQEWPFDKSHGRSNMPHDLFLVARLQANKLPTWMGW
jgi:hypothetical protein